MTEAHVVWGSLEQLESDSSSIGTSKKDPHRSNDFVKLDVVFNSSETSSSAPTSDQYPAKANSNPSKLHDPDTTESYSTLSVGSALHASGHCTPCGFFSSKGCIKGQACAFCHAPHAKKNRPRPSKYTRMQCRQVIEMLDVIQNPKEKLVAGQELSAQSPYMRSIINNKLQNTHDTNTLKASGEPVPKKTPNPNILSL